MKPKKAYVVTASRTHQGARKVKQFTLPWEHLPKRMRAEGWVKVEAKEIRA